jgi:hypothetical protein
VRLGQWAVYGAERDGRFVALDTEHRQLVLLDLLRLRAARCDADAADTVARRVPLHGGALPYRAHLVGDRLFVSFFSENRLEVYRWPDLAWERDVRFDGAENLGLSDMDVDGATLLVSAAGYVCFTRDCPNGRFHASHLYFVDTSGPLLPPFAEARPANVNTLSVLARPGFIVSAGDLDGGHGSLQRIHADRTLGPEIRLPAAASPETAHLVDDATLVVHQMAGEHLFVIDVAHERLRRILRFDGRAFVSLPLDTATLPAESAAELQDLQVDPHDRRRLFLVDMKRDRLIRARYHPEDGTLSVERIESLAAGSTRRATQWLVWLP